MSRAKRNLVARARRGLVLVPLAFTLAGCMQTVTGSVAGGECRIFERPAYAVRGLRTYDQTWIDSQVEGGVGGCGWQRPLPRPAALDAPAGKGVAMPTSAPRKRSLLARLKAKVVHKPVADAPTFPEAPQPAIAPVPPLPEPAPVHGAPSPPSAPPDPLDQLLNPSGPRVQR